MAKRRFGEIYGGRAAKRRLQHLYLFFDDWSSVYSIRKVDLCGADASASDSESDDDVVENLRAGSGAEPPLPASVFRVPGARGMPQSFASAFGSRIMAMQPRKRGTDGEHQVVPKDLVPVFDVAKRGIIWGPRPDREPADPIYFPVGDRLFALGAKYFEQLWPPPLEYPGGDRAVWQWTELPNPPFKRRHVTSYALHPDGRTILVSTERRGAAATFAFDTDAAKFEWEEHGDWALPFDGRAHFDAELDSFVGLPSDPESLGHLCSCDAAPTSSDDGEGQHAIQARKLSKEKLFSEDPAETHVGAKLVYMGRRSKFCLVQCISMEDDCIDQELEEEDDVPRRHLFRLTTFSLSYDKNEDLTTGRSRRVRSCRVPKASTEFVLKNPVAFWL